MKLVLPLALVLLAGCATHGSVSVNGGTGGTSGGGTSISTSSAGLNVQTGSSNAAALIGLGMAIIAVNASERNYGRTYSANPFMAMSPASWRPVPELDPTRKVNEQDCTQPIDFTAGNVRCR